MGNRETSWLIETTNHEYWNGRGLGREAFVPGEDNALRFARFEDAEIVRCWLLERFTFAIRSVEHIWLGDGIKMRIDRDAS